MNNETDLIQTNEDKLFLQIQILKSYVKELKFENGVLQSEKHELKHEIKSLREIISNQRKTINSIKGIDKHSLYFKGIKETMGVLITKATGGIIINISEVEEIIERSFRRWSKIRKANEIDQRLINLENETTRNQ